MNKTLSAHWRQFYMRLANEIATGSKDASTKIGAVLVRPDKTVASIGFNGFPKRIKDDETILTDITRRSDKYARIVHAEANCLNHNRDFDTTGFHMVVNCHPCDRCALRIASTGISYVYYEANEEFETRWADSLSMARQILEEADVMLIPVKLDDHGKCSSQA